MGVNYLEKSTIVVQGNMTIDTYEEGSGPLIPKGAVVSYHYVSRLEDGTELSSSYDKNGHDKPFGIILGHGHVIKGLEEAIL